MNLTSWNHYMQALKQPPCPLPRFLLAAEVHREISPATEFGRRGYFIGIPRFSAPPRLTAPMPGRPRFYTYILDTQRCGESWNLAGGPYTVFEPLFLL